MSESLVVCVFISHKKWNSFELNKSKGEREREITPITFFHSSKIVLNIEYGMWIFLYERFRRLLSLYPRLTIDLHFNSTWCYIVLFSHLFNEQRSIVTFAHSLSAVLTVAKIEIKFRRIVCVCAYDWSTVFKIKKNGTNIFCIARV